MFVKFLRKKERSNPTSTIPLGNKPGQENLPSFVLEGESWLHVSV